MNPDTAAIIGSISTASGFLAAQLGTLLGSGGPLAVILATIANKNNQPNPQNPSPPSPTQNQNQSSGGTGIPQVDMFLAAAKQAWGRIEAMGVGAFRVLVTSVTRYLDPRTIATSAVNAPTSGMSVLDKAFKILGATLGLILLPIFATLAAIVLAVAMNIEAALIPAINSLTTFMADNLPEAFQNLEASFVTLTEVMGVLYAATYGATEALLAMPQKLANLFGSDLKGLIWDVLAGSLSGVANLFGLDLKGLIGDVLAGSLSEVHVPAIQDRFAENKAKIQARDKQSESGIEVRYTDAEGNQRTERSDAKGNPIQKSFTDQVREQLGNVREEFKRGVGGPSQSSSIADIGRQIQQAALNQSPFETKMLELMQKALESLDNFGQKLAKPVKP